MDGVIESTVLSGYNRSSIQILYDLTEANGF